MENVIIGALEGQSIWTICCVCLTVYVLRTSGDREIKLHDIIDKLTDKLDMVDEIREDVEEIKQIITKEV